MKVLLPCPTYARLPFLGRVLASFLSQDYDEKHLVFINDDKNVRISCDFENVTCINSNRRLLLPQKRNLANTIGYYDIIMPHDDDDIFLPNRISNHVVKHIQHPEIDLFQNTASFLVSGEIMDYGSCSPMACSYTRKSWWDVEGYAHHQHTGEDQEFFNKIKHKMVIDDPSECDFIYNWGGINYHASYENVPYEKIAMEQLVSMDLVGSEFKIEPDYVQYGNFIYLAERLKKTKEPVRFKHLELGKIEI